LIPLICYHGGNNDPAASVNEIKADPAKLRALEDAVDDLFKGGGPPAAPTGGVAPPSPNPLPLVPRAYMWVSPLISAAIIIGFFAMLAVLMTRDAASVEKLGGLQNVLFTLLGALAAAFTQVCNYWLGSSKGSSDKTDLLEKSIRAPPTGQ
jgi:hypothetical protein